LNFEERIVASRDRGNDFFHKVVRTVPCPPRQQAITFQFKKTARAVGTVHAHPISLRIRRSQTAATAKHGSRGRSPHQTSFWPRNTRTMRTSLGWDRIKTAKAVGTGHAETSRLSIQIGLRSQTARYRKAWLAGTLAPPKVIFDREIRGLCEPAWGGMHKSGESGPHRPCLPDKSENSVVTDRRYSKERRAERRASLKDATYLPNHQN